MKKLIIFNSMIKVQLVTINELFNSVLKLQVKYGIFIQLKTLIELY